MLKIRHFGWSWLVLALGATYACALEVEDCKVPGAATDLKRCSALLDSYGDSKLRPDVPDGFRTDVGLQFHPACFKVAEAKGFSKDKAKALLKSYTERVYRKMTQDCVGRYSAFSKYILGGGKGEAATMGWATQVRRTVITCAPITPEEPNYGAKNFPHKKAVESSKELPKSAWEGISFSGGARDSLARNHESVIAFSGRELGVILQNEENVGGHPDTDSTLAHEILHATAGNNLFDHNKCERIQFSEQNACSHNIADDRVNLIADLCTGNTHNWGGKTPQNVLFKRMELCKKKTGCLDAFTSTSPGFWEADNVVDGVKYERDKNNFNSIALDQSEAEDVCNEIEDDGRCEDVRKTDWQAFAKKQPELVKVGKRVAAKLEKVLPKTTNDIPAEILTSSPDFESEAKALSDSPCFEAAFFNKLEPGKPLYVRMSPAIAVDVESSPHGMKNWKLERFAAAQKNIEKSSRCAEAPSSEKSRVLLFLDRIERRMVRGFSSQTFKKMARPRLLGNAEVIATTAADPSGLETDFAKLMGPELMRDYLSALETYHPRSSRFDCVAAGLSPYRAAKLAKKGAGKLALSSPMHCPD